MIVDGIKRVFFPCSLFLFRFLTLYFHSLSFHSLSFHPLQAHAFSTLHPSDVPTRHIALRRDVGLDRLFPDVVDGSVFLSGSGPSGQTVDDVSDRGVDVDEHHVRLDRLSLVPHHQTGGFGNAGRGKTEVHRY